MPKVQNMEGIDLYSDTHTLPTNEMRQAMYSAEVGDDNLKEDPTVNRLETIAANKVGTEAALFVPSGHMGNLIATMVYCQEGEEVIIENQSHHYYYESGGMASIAGVMPRFVDGDNGIFGAEEVVEVMRPLDIHFPKTSLIWLENPHNLAGGTVVPLKVMQELRDLADKHQLSLHLDGARLFNAAQYLKVDPSVIVSKVDSVMFCLSKGLSAPVGSILAGSEEFIKKAYRKRKILGGAMRQAGVVAAAGVIALQEMVERLEIDHRNAKKLGKGLSKIPGYDIDLETVQTNMVYVNVSNLGLSTDDFLDLLEKNGITATPHYPTSVRFVTHRHITSAHIEKVLSIVKKIT